MKWEELETDSAIQWLLEPDNPSVRFWALQQLVDMNPGDREVVQAQELIMDTPCVKAILSAQKPEGHWENHKSIYIPKYTAGTHNLLILAELGVKRTPHIEAAIEHVFQFQRTSGHFLMDMPKTEKGRDSTVKDGCCYDGNILYYLLHFGYLDDPRTQRLIDFQMEYHSDEGGWKCRAFPIDAGKVFPSNCFMGRMKVLRALVKIPQEKRPSSMNRIIKTEVEEILQNGIYKYLKNPDGSRKEKAGWKRFGFPLFYQSDALEVLDFLTEAGIQDPRMEDALQLVLDVRSKDGRWILKNTYNGKMVCDVEAKNQPSKWITLRALRTLKRYYA